MARLPAPGPGALRNFITGALLVLATPLAAQQPTPRQIAARARAAVVLITALRGGQEVGVGSGFIVSADGKIVTNRHVIEDATSLLVQLADGEIYDRVYLVSDDGRRDLVILRVPAAGLPTLRFGDDRSVQMGDRVYVMGNPRGLEGTFSDGLVSARRTEAGTQWLQITAPISPGSSGGPVLNAAGEVIGVATLSMRDAQNLNMAVAGRYAQGLLAMNETPRPFGPLAGRPASHTADNSPRSGDNTPRGSAGNSPRSSAARPDNSELAPWARALERDSEWLDSVSVSNGFVPTHPPRFELLHQGRTAEVPILVTWRGPLLIVGFCDRDCDDLDLTLYDYAGREVDSDAATNATPAAAVPSAGPGTYKVRVYMARCRVEPCGFGLRAYGPPR